MLKNDVLVKNNWGLHVKVAVQLVRVASGYPCSITMEHNKRIADVKSIMGLLVMGVTQNSTVSITCDGVDELDAMDAITDVLSNFEIP